MTWKIPLFKTYGDNDDVESVTETIEKGMYWARVIYLNKHYMKRNYWKYSSKETP